MPPRFPRCLTCIEESDKCFRGTADLCLTCNRKERECIMPGNVDDTPEPASQRSTPLSNVPDPLPTQETPAGIRRERDTPTAVGWGRSSHISSLVRTPIPDQQQPAQPVTLGKRPAGIRSPDAENIEEREERVKRLELALDVERAEVEKLKNRKALEDIVGPSLAPLPSLETAMASLNRPRSSSNSSTDTVIPGFVAGSSELLPPESVIKNIKGGWKRPFSMALLTDDYCRRKGGASRQKTSLTYDASSSLLTAVEDELVDPTCKEEDLSYEDWSRAYRRFLSILKQHLPKYYERWKIHFDYIQDRPELSAHWRLWLRYDIKLRERTREERRIDVTTFQKSIYDELLPAFQAEKALEAMQRGLATLSDPYHRSAQALSLGVAFAVAGLVTAPSHAPKPAKPLDAPSSSSRTAKVAGLSMAPRSATSSTSHPVHAHGPNASVLTSVPYVAQAPTVPKPAQLPSDPRRVTTPLLPNAWESTLTELDLKEEFGDISPGLTSGFRIGATRSLDRSYIIPNHKSALDNPSVVQDAIKKEVALGRYSGPFTFEELETRIGFFRTAPLGVVAKSSPGEFRIIQDFSHSKGGHPALNDEIDSDLFQCEWGFFRDVVEIILRAPADAEAATFDVDAAYRRMPVHPDDQQHIIVMWMDQFWVDHCVPFGAGSSNGIFGRCGDAMARICTARGLGPVLKWVDDFLFFRYPQDGTYLYSECDIIAIATHLGWPWKEAKTRPFSAIFIYLGFEWDICHRTVLIPPGKQEKYIARLKEWLSLPRVSLKLTEMILGSLVHCTQVITGGRPRLAGLFSFQAAITNNPHARFHDHTPSSRALSDARWWLQQLSEGPCTLHIQPDPPPYDHECFMDASTLFGIGIIVKGGYAAWRLEKGWKKPGRDIGWAEMAAVELALGQAIDMGIKDHTLKFRSDNQGVVFALQAGRSRNEAQNQILMRILSTADRHGIKLEISYIRSEDNPADAPSRGLKPPNYIPISSPVALPSDLVDLLSIVTLE
ncbi:reverse transcriptase domain protein, putative, partial [Rhizoctonia solani AG-3 Rhs1AP]